MNDKQFTSSCTQLGHRMMIHRDRMSQRNHRTGKHWGRERGREEREKVKVRVSVEEQLEESFKITYAS